MLDATLMLAGRDGFANLSLTAIAAEAGTTRPALYRRWGSKTEIMTDAVAKLARTDFPAFTGAPYDDLVAELKHFQHCITMSGALPLVGLILSGAVTEQVQAAYSDQIVKPRRARLRRCLTEARNDGLIAPDADLEVAGSFLTGSWYSFHLAGLNPPADWARRTANLVWKACGGEFHDTPPDSHTQEPATPPS